MYRVAAACQEAHIIVCGCHLACFLIYERRGQEPDDLIDGLVAWLSTGELRSPETYCLILVCGRSERSISFAISRARVLYRDSRFEIRGPEPRQAREVDSVHHSASRPRTKDLGVLAISPVHACIHDTHDFFCVKNNRGTAVSRLSW